MIDSALHRIYTPWTTTVVRKENDFVAFTLRTRTDLPKFRTIRSFPQLQQAVANLTMSTRVTLEHATYTKRKPHEFLLTNCEIACIRLKSSFLKNTHFRVKLGDTRSSAGTATVRGSPRLDVITGFMNHKGHSEDRSNKTRFLRRGHRYPYNICRITSYHSTSSEDI